jgi:tetratricopeptide (TPR) repeat protein
MVSYDQNPHFLGRDRLLLRLRQKLQETNPKQYNHRVAIYGLGGVGKTQIAIEYVYRYKDSYQNIYWISAADQASLLSGFLEIGQITGCLIGRGRTDMQPMEVAKDVLAWLRMQENWLLIIDNLDDVNVGHGLLPGTQKGGHTLITTRNVNTMNIAAESLEIPVFGEDDAVELFRIHSEMTEAELLDSRTVANDIVRELGYLPLAIDHAAAFIRSTAMVITDFLPIYHGSRKELLSRASYDEKIYPNSVAVTFLLSFNKMKSNTECGTEASRLLKLFAFLNPDGILIDFLKAGSSGLSDEIRRVFEPSQSYLFRESLGLLRQYSLIGLSKKKDSIIIHRLIQAVLKDELSDPEMQQYCTEVIELCLAAFPSCSDVHEIRGIGRLFQSQVVEPAFEAAKLPSHGAAVVLGRIGSFLSDDGKLKDAERLGERACQILQSLLGNEHPDTLTLMSLLASTYGHRGKLQEAATLQERVLEARRRTLGEEHRDTLISINNLAQTYSHQGKLQEAATLKERVLEARRRTLGEEHRDTLISINNLALTYYHQGKLQEAATLQERVLEAQRRTLEEEHPATLISINNLAATYYNQGKLEEAGALEERVLEARRRIMGEEHPETLLGMTNLALTYERLGRIAEALSLMQQAVDGSQRSLGDGHPHVAVRKIIAERLRNKCDRTEQGIPI